MLIYWTILLLVEWIAAATNELNYFETYFVEPHIDTRNAIKLEQYKWPNGVVPYVFHTDYSKLKTLVSFSKFYNYKIADAVERSTVLDSMEAITDSTCVQFVTKTKLQTEHIRFTKVRVQEID